MTQHTAPAGLAAGQSPVDIETMRETIERTLGLSSPPAAEELDLVLDRLRGHVGLMIPEVEAIAERLPKSDVHHFCAHACVGEARRKLSVPARPTLLAELDRARFLARVLGALCEHHTTLSGGSSS